MSTWRLGSGPDSLIFGIFHVFYKFYIWKKIE
jgi:hypothetical protein